MNLKNEVEKVLTENQDWKILETDKSEYLLNEIIRKLEIRKTDVFPWETSIGRKTVQSYDDRWKHIMAEKFMSFGDEVTIVVTAEEVPDKWFFMQGNSMTGVGILEELPFFEYGLFSQTSMSKFLFDTHSNQLVEIEI